MSESNDAKHSSGVHPGGPLKAVGVLLEALQREASGNAHVRKAMLEVSAWLGDAAEASLQPKVGGPSQLAVSIGDQSSLNPGESVESTPEVVQVRESPLSRMAVSASAVRPTAGSTAESGFGSSVTKKVDSKEIDLRNVVKRARLKAEACRWTVERRRRLKEDPGLESEIKPLDRKFIDRAHQLEDCFLWSLDAYREMPDDESMVVIEACYENLALCVEMAGDVVSCSDVDEEFVKQVFNIVAETQSALRYSLRESNAVKWDQDQSDTFTWLKSETFGRRIYIERHMKVTDPANPREWQELRGRILAMHEEWKRKSPGRPPVMKVSGDSTASMGTQSVDSGVSGDGPDLLFNQARYHASRISEGHSNDNHEWDRMFDALNRLIELDVSPADDRIREIFGPLAGSVPGHLAPEMGTGVSRIVDELDQGGELVGLVAGRLEATDGVGA